MNPEYIILHHSLTKDGETVSWDNIREYHTKVQGWRAVGYHYGIEMVDNTKNYEIFIGRFPDEIGAHCVPRNRDSIGICLIGNFDESPPPQEQWNKALDLCHYLVRQFGVLTSNVLGHREAQENRTCPGKYFDVDKFRLELNNRRWNKIG